MEIAVTLEGVTKRFGDLVAVEAVSFSAGGEIFGIVGNNGAGKSTLFQMIVGLLRPDAGRITRFGGKGGDPRAQIGYLPEKTLLYPRLTPWEFLDFVARIRGIPAPPIDEELERFHLLSHRDDLIEGLSFGMRRKVGLIAAMLGAPPLVILDEPLNGLDVASMDLVEARLREIVGEGRTVLFSSHYLDFAERICDRIAVLRRGRLLACDAPAALREAYGKGSLLEIFRLLHRKDAPN
ncbi:MAG: ABC transporter ATP-binding protein [Deltaproteobacteria bacterium]|nr:MAG: ABC transporter ATP-binding protein [Deltaproteobacteria bacterium]